MEDPKVIKLSEMLGPLEEEMEFFFTNFFGTSYPSLYRKELCWKPPTDVYETEDEFVVIMELAQMSPEDVSITLQEEILTIRGVRKAIPPAEQRRYHKMEVNYGPFERKIAIPVDLDMDALEATYQDGFLEIRLPKSDGPDLQNFDIEIE